MIKNFEGGEPPPFLKGNHNCVCCALMRAGRGLRISPLPTPTPLFSYFNRLRGYRARRRLPIRPNSTLPSDPRKLDGGLVGVDSEGPLTDIEDGYIHTDAATPTLVSDMEITHCPTVIEDFRIDWIRPPDIQESYENDLIPSSSLPTKSTWWGNRGMGALQHYGRHIARGSYW